MCPLFDGCDVARYVQEAAELRRTHEMSWSAQPIAIEVDGKWMLWWRDHVKRMWLHRTEDGVVHTAALEV